MWLLILILGTKTAIYADRTDRCLDYIQKRYFYTVDSIINDWEKDSILSPDYYAVKANYFFNKARKEAIHIDKITPKNIYKIPIKHVSSGEEFYIYEEKRYRPAFIDSAIFYVKKGTQLYPKRLDLWFGLAYIYQEIGDIDAQSRTLSMAVEYSLANLDSMLWAKDSAMIDTDSFLIESLHSYTMFYYKTEEDKKLVQLANLHVKYFPNSVIGLNDLGIYYGFKKLYRKALKQFMLAYEIDKSDMILVNNIAFMYENLNDVSNAIKFYTIVADSALDIEQKTHAGDRIKSLKNSSK